MLKKNIILLVFTFFFMLKVHAQSNNLAIINVKIYPAPDVDPISNGTIIIEQGKITCVGDFTKVKVPQDYKIIDGKGKVATAAFWNSHVHFTETYWQNSDKISKEKLEGYLKKMLTGYGFAYAFDLAELDFENLNNLRERINLGELDGPTILSVGIPFTSKSPYYIQPAVLPELKSITGVSEHIKEQLANGANGIKIWSGSPTGNAIEYMPGDLIRLAGEICKSNHVPLFAHPSSTLGVEMAVDNGVNILAHTSPDDKKNWEPALVEKMISNNVCLIPTLNLFKWELEQDGINNLEDPLIKTSINQLKDFASEGGGVLFGTDVGYMTEYNTTYEYILMAKAGMDFNQILATLTTNPAKIFGHESETGKIEVGMKADLVILERDPILDIKNFAEVKYTFKDGKCIYNKNLDD